MLKFTGQLAIVDILTGDFISDLNERAGQLIREAARAFIIAVLHSIKNAPHTTGGDTFPVQTGEAKASLRPLGRLLNQLSGVSFNITPAPGKEDRTSQGESLGKAQLIDNRNSGNRFIYSFTWSTEVLHYVLNEDEHNSSVKSSTPWHSVDAGQAAAEAYIENNYERFVPNLNDYIFSVDGPNNVQIGGVKRV